MDKWKESELEKMKVGGNRKMKTFLEERDESSLPIRTKYNTKAASLYKDKVTNSILAPSSNTEVVHILEYFISLFGNIYRFW